MVRWKNVWPRATQGPKRSFVVFVLLGGVESWAKIFPNGTKKVRKQKMFQMEQKVFANRKCAKWNIKCAREQKMLQWEQSVILYDTLWYWSAMFALHGPVWSRMVLLLLFTAINMFGLVWRNIVFSRGHRSKFIWSCFNYVFELQVNVILAWMQNANTLTTYV